MKPRGVSFNRSLHEFMGLKVVIDSGYLGGRARRMSSAKQSQGQKLTVTFRALEAPTAQYPAAASMVGEEGQDPSALEEMSSFIHENCMVLHLQEVLFLALENTLTVDQEGKMLHLALVRMVKENLLRGHWSWDLNEEKEGAMRRSGMSIPTLL